ncbi:cobalt-precorrin 5A hydrolase [Candidatus Magnetaquicoccus inordinatus]|uniref:cobalt-precorrin 5A hydrolase n=1 Tax=Candidatus Magnetaquicoccus inordinatus TaxID=2496818 RepID=UPI00102CF68D|nr:cobalamin biosynthesis protein [Candidatus Magnetaquicoccus inordinatus]
MKSVEGNARSPALIALTRNGAQQAARLHKLWPEAQLFLLHPWDQQWPEQATTLFAPLRQYIPELLAKHHPILFFAAVGAVVRLIAPHLGSKESDPALLVCDESARFVIPLLSGHQGGANQQALRVARLLGAMPVITTASDNQNILAVDLLGQPLGWSRHASAQALIRVAAAVVNGAAVAWVQECGSKRWRINHPQLPAHIHPLPNIESADPERYQALLWITQSRDPTAIAQQWPDRMIRYAPPLSSGTALWLGMGCDRDTPFSTLLEVLQEAQLQQFFSWEQIVGLASIDRKADEAALLELAERFALPLTLFSAEQLAQTAVANPSQKVLQHVGTPSVAEAAALLAAGPQARLWLPKIRHRGAEGKNVTLALAHCPSPPPPP